MLSVAGRVSIPDRVKVLEIWACTQVHIRKWINPAAAAFSPTAGWFET